MKSWQAWVPLSLMLLTVGAHAATEIGTITVVEGGARLLRGATWYKVVRGARVEEADIIEASDRTQVQIEFGSGSVANLAGAATMYVLPATTKSPQVVLQVTEGWLKIAANPPGLRVRSTPFDIVLANGIVVAHAAGPAADIFVESGSGKLVELAANGADGPARDVKVGEYWSKTASNALATVPRAPKAFIAVMPRHFIDPLPVLAAKMKAKPVLVAEREITYAEAALWLAGRDRAVFERRFASRLRDPVFRNAARPDLAHYPAWDRMLNPEKYAPKETPAQ